MLAWLDRFFNSAAADIGAGISSAVHWAVSAVTRVVLAVFGLVKGAWAVLADSIAAFHAGLDRFASEVVSFADWVTHVLVPRILHWAEAELARLAAALARLYEDLQRAINNLILRIAVSAKQTQDWVITHVWDPLKAYADLIWSDLKKWGYTAWWWVTHPAQLAEALIFDIANSMEKHAWELGRMLGTFALSLVTSNLRRFITLIEDILEAVI